MKHRFAEVEGITYRLSCPVFHEPELDEPVLEAIKAADYQAQLIIDDRRGK